MADDNHQRAVDWYRYGYFSPTAPATDPQRAPIEGTENYPGTFFDETPDSPLQTDSPYPGHAGAGYSGASDHAERGAFAEQPRAPANQFRAAHQYGAPFYRPQSSSQRSTTATWYDDSEPREYRGSATSPQATAAGIYRYGTGSYGSVSNAATRANWTESGPQTPHQSQTPRGPPSSGVGTFYNDDNPNSPRSPQSTFRNAPGSSHRSSLVHPQTAHKRGGPGDQWASFGTGTSGISGPLEYVKRRSEASSNPDAYHAYHAWLSDREGVLKTDCEESAYQQLVEKQSVSSDCLQDDFLHHLYGDDPAKYPKAVRWIEMLTALQSFRPTSNTQAPENPSSDARGFPDNLRGVLPRDPDIRSSTGSQELPRLARHYASAVSPYDRM